MNMEQFKKKSFHPLKKDELGNVFGGKTTIAYYKDENGNIKIKIVQTD
jgi:hypothetical protein